MRLALIIILSQMYPIYTFPADFPKINCSIIVRTRGRWEDNIRMDLREILSKGVDWTYLAQLWALMNTLTE
jgi:hypothetical protein